MKTEALAPCITRTLNRSHFQSEAHYILAERILKSLMTYKIEAPRTEEGGVTVFDALDAIANGDPSLEYLDFEHLSEIYLRHYPQTFSIEGDYLIPTRPPTAGLPVTPPDTLYFGTLRSIANLAAQKGLLSSHHPHVVVTSDRSLAEKRAYDFARDKEGVSPALLIVDAAAAYASGTLFLGGDKSHLFKAEHISRNFLINKAL
jgi:hypothetical protein